VQTLTPLELYLYPREDFVGLLHHNNQQQTPAHTIIKKARYTSKPVHRLTLTDFRIFSTLISRAVTMTDIEVIANAVQGLSIAGDVQDHEPEPSRPMRYRGALHNTIHMLDEVTITITSQAQHIESVADGSNSSANWPIKKVCSFHAGAEKLTNITAQLSAVVDTLNEAAERSVIRHLASLGSQSGDIAIEGRTTLIQQLFAHFETKIRSIIRKAFKTTDNQSLLWKIAEECYKQANSRSGTLNADDYFIPLEEAQPVWLYDSDFESEKYYEHEDRLGLDEGYARAFQERVERRDEVRRKQKQSWPDFWFRVLSNAPDGPTLFHPPASRKTGSLRFDALPQYLFRTFDEDSSGRNDESVIASIASHVGPDQSSRIDLLALQDDRVVQSLHRHLTKSCFGGAGSDNLMSWTSSLLFAIQYAVWRRRQRRCHPSEIKICAVDTRRFPSEQFARDTWLLEAYKPTGQQEDPALRAAQRFFKFRLEDERFYNGEYLSQGAVNHANRSCVVSLESLIQAGLFNLYPEFEDAQGSERWANRALELRQIWSEEQQTTDSEILLALQVACNCFRRFEPCDIASILLAFKNRRYSKPTPTSKCHFHFCYPMTIVPAAPNPPQVPPIVSANIHQNGQTSQMKSVDTG
jgi:hypothetical protein